MIADAPKRPGLQTRMDPLTVDMYKPIYACIQYNIDFCSMWVN